MPPQQAPSAQAVPPPQAPLPQRVGRVSHPTPLALGPHDGRHGMTHPKRYHTGLTE